MCILRCPLCNGYRRRKWTRRHEFKSWTKKRAFHIALIPLGKVWIQLFSFQLWLNSRADWVLQPWLGNYSKRRKTVSSNLLKLRLKIDLVPYPARAKGLLNMYVYPCAYQLLLLSVNSFKGLISVYNCSYIIAWKIKSDFNIKWLKMPEQAIKPTSQPINQINIELSTQGLKRQ